MVPERAGLTVEGDIVGVGVAWSDGALRDHGGPILASGPGLEKSVPML